MEDRKPLLQSGNKVKKEPSQNKVEREEDNLSIGISTASLEFSCLHKKISEEEIAAMALCPPTYVIPSCASTPQFGLGSAGASAGLGLGGRGLGGGLQGGSISGLQGGSMGGLGGGLLGGGVSSGELGTLSGIVPQPINQIPPAEIVIQPPSFIVTIPGPILSASSDPVAIGGNTPCAAPGSRILGRPSAPSRGLLGGRNLQEGRGNITLSNTKTNRHLHNILEDTFFFVHVSMCSRSHKPRLHFPKEPEITHDVLPPMQMGSQLMKRIGPRMVTMEAGG
ncbi:Keratin, type II cytoskeletal 3, partial [Ophiophagus hannah]